MYLDKQNEFSDSQAVTATAISTNVIDRYAGTNVGNINNVTVDEGGGDGMYLVIQVDTTATAAGAATVTVTLESDSTANLATAPVVHVTTKAFSIAEMVGGATLYAVCLPVGDYKRYIGARYTVSTGPLTAGAFSAFLTTDFQKFKAYARNWAM